MYLHQILLDDFEKSWLNIANVNLNLNRVTIYPHRAEVIDIICNTGELKSFSKFEISY